MSGFFSPRIPEQPLLRPITTTGGWRRKWDEAIILSFPLSISSLSFPAVKARGKGDSERRNGEEKGKRASQFFPFPSLTSLFSCSTSIKFTSEERDEWRWHEEEVNEEEKGHSPAKRMDGWVDKPSFPVASLRSLSSLSLSHSFLSHSFPFIVRPFYLPLPSLAYGQAWHGKDGKGRRREWPFLRLSSPSLFPVLSPSFIPFSSRSLKVGTG